MTLAQYFSLRRSPHKVEFATSLGMPKSYLSRLLSGDRLAGRRWIGPIVVATKGRVRAGDLNPRLAHLYTANGKLK